MASLGHEFQGFRNILEVSALDFMMQFPCIFLTTSIAVVNFATFCASRKPSLMRLFKTWIANVLIKHPIDNVTEWLRFHENVFSGAISHFLEDFVSIRSFLQEILILQSDSTLGRFQKISNYWDHRRRYSSVSVFCAICIGYQNSLTHATSELLIKM